MFGQKSCYVSEFATFMDGYLKAHPEVAQGQLEGRALLWDKPALDEEAQRHFQEAGVKQKAYPYQTN